MIKEESNVEVAFFVDSGTSSPITLKIYSPRNNEQAILCLARSEAQEYGEEQIQLLEGLRYEYELSNPSFRLQEENGSGVIYQSTNPKLAHCGTLATGLNTGKLVLVATDTTKLTRATAVIEIRPRKLGHREHYRQMLEEITDACVALAMELRAPTNMKAAPSPGSSSETIHQRFSFLKALINSTDFQNALHRITTHPHKRWEAEHRQVDVRRNFRPNAHTMRSISKASRRIPIPCSHPLSSVLNSVPVCISQSGSFQTGDTKENQFVKFVLQRFVSFLRSMRTKLEDINNNKVSRGQKNNEVDARLRLQIESLETRLLHSLDADVFRNLSTLELFPANSPVLQRKEGYREIFQSWLKFDLAARLVWTGGNDVYGAGQKDVATLYEYWVFFKLLNIVSNFFQLDIPVAKSLIEETEDGFGVKLKSGQQLAFDAVYDGGSRRLRIQFGYNRSFAPNKKHDVGGSWTQLMRPDYTLSLWPAALEPHSSVCLSLEDAEKLNLVSHIHFDAKYRVDNIQDIFGSGNEFPNETETLRPLGTHKRDDLLKMHAYRDAIRRTHGAYVLYPGDVQSSWEEYHELLPGLGAFPMRPGCSNVSLEKFIHDVVEHICNRATQREQVSFHTYRIHKTAKDFKLSIPLPEFEDGSRERVYPPDEKFVLLGPTNSELHFDWVCENKIYTLRLDESDAQFTMHSCFVAAQYVLVCSPKLEPRIIFMRVRSNGVRITTGSVLKRKGCPDVVNNDVYLIFDLEEFTPLQYVQWNISNCPNTEVLSLEKLLSAYAHL